MTPSIHSVITSVWQRELYIDVLPYIIKNQCKSINFGSFDTLKISYWITEPCWVYRPSLPFSLDVFREADLVRKTSLIFEALQGFYAHAQCAPLSNRGNHWCSVGVIPSIACVSVQSTYSWLWGQLTLLFILLFINDIRLPTFQKSTLKSLEKVRESGFHPVCWFLFLSKGFLD